jgi:hypothetical protein
MVKAQMLHVMPAQQAAAPAPAKDSVLIRSWQPAIALAGGSYVACTHKLLPSAAANLGF